VRTWWCHAVPGPSNWHFSVVCNGHLACARQSFPGNPKISQHPWISYGIPRASFNPVSKGEAHENTEFSNTLYFLRPFSKGSSNALEMYCKRRELWKRYEVAQALHDWLNRALVLALLISILIRRMVIEIGKLFFWENQWKTGLQSKFRDILFATNNVQIFWF
jgi:hypothetical protein